MRLRWALTLLVLLGSATTAQAAVTLPAPGMLKADGSINSLTRAGGRLILSGTFQHIGPYVGGGLGVEPNTGAIDPGFTRLDGQVSDVVGDGRDGWYVGGQFLIGGQRRAVTHVLASGEIDPDFDATVGSFVTSLALADGTLYAGRYFWPNAKDRGVVALDAVTGERKPFASPRGGSGVTELLLAGDRLYVGQDGAYAVDPQTGAKHAGFDCADCPEGVTALAHAGDSLYVGGTNGVIAVDGATGARRPAFAPAYTTERGAPPYEPEVGARVLLVDGDRLLVGGESLPFDGPSRTLAAVDLQTGQPDPSFARGFRNPIFDMILDGETLVTGGRRRDGRDATAVIRLDRGTGRFQYAIAMELDGPIDALAGGNTRFFVGGRFGTAHAIATDGVAAVDVRTGRLVPGFAVDGMPKASLGARPLVAGDSLIFPSQSSRTSSVVAFSRRTGAARRAFSAPVLPAASYTTVWAADADHLFASYPTGDGAGGMWTQDTVSVLSSRTGRRVARYDLPYPGYVDAMLAHRGQLFVGGSFRRFGPGGVPRHLATMAVDQLTGTIDDGFDAHTNGPVGTIVGFADRLYLSGIYDIAYGLKREGSSSAYTNTGAIVAGFSAGTTAFGVGGGFLDARNDNFRVVRASPYTGRRFGRVPAIEGGYGSGFLGEALITDRGAFVTATLNLPYDGDRSYYDSFAGLLPMGGKVAGPIADGR